jgi:hypothetical protein
MHFSSALYSSQSHIIAEPAIASAISLYCETRAGWVSDAINTAMHKLKVLRFGVALDQFYVVGLVELVELLDLSG